MKKQKTISIMKSPGYDFIAGCGLGDSYLFSQCKGNSGIDRDLNNGWIVKHIWEDRFAVVILLEFP